MLIVNDKLLSRDIVEVRFECDLQSCKGACCSEGDFGAPLEEDEINTIQDLLPDIMPLITAQAKKVIKKEGVWKIYEDDEPFKGTTLVDNRDCVFLTADNDGYKKCAFEVLYEMGNSRFWKPISCHLYPIRIEENPARGFTALNYDDWSICSAACQKGKNNNTRLYTFAKEAIIRKYGEEFYRQIDEAAKNHFS